MPMPHTPGFPLVVAAGTPEQRGRMYGFGAKELIHRSISAYEKVFHHSVGWSWDEVRGHARRFSKVIEEFSPSSFREMHGIAEGAGLHIDDVIALNTRSEIMFLSPATTLPPMECSSFALMPESTTHRLPVIGQNWDWLEHARHTTVLLQVRRDDGPDFLTLVEAGLLAKVGLNEAGVGLCTNTLISDGAEGGSGVPYHLLLRSVLDDERGESAVARIEATPRANSANYVVADTSGFCVDLETTPAPGGTRRFEPSGTFAHTNHFLASELTGVDRYVARKSHTLDRLDNLRRALDEASHERALDVDGLAQVLSDHGDYPGSVCLHGDPDYPVEERSRTIAGIVLDLATSSMHVAPGNPCEAVWEEHRL